jgi:predicted TIM-barrel fold metal-dependent hydrolase
MDSAGVDVQLISHTVVEPAPSDRDVWSRAAQDANEQLAAAVAEHPTRFAGLATLPMLAPDVAASELGRAVITLGLRGAMINGSANGLFIDDPIFTPILERAVELDVPIYLHPGPVPQAVFDAYYTGLAPGAASSLSAQAWGWHAETAIHALRLIVSGVFDRLPALKIVIGHMGEMIPFMTWRIDKCLAPHTSHLRRRPIEYFHSNFYVTTSGVFDSAAFDLTLQVVGADRILFAIDYPYASSIDGRHFLDGLRLRPEDRDRITHQNAQELFGLDPA